MTSRLKGVEAYYSTLEVLNAPTTIRGRVTTQLEMALPGTFEAKGSPTGKESFKKMQAAPGYEVALDSKDILLCPTPGIRKSLISSSPRKTPRKSTSPI